MPSLSCRNKSLTLAAKNYTKPDARISGLAVADPEK